MHLYALPLVFILGGLILYVVLGGADFGAGFWQLAAGRGEKADRLREHAHHSMGPVWEANHVWLIFVITVLWTAYPVAFGSIASTLSLPLLVAMVGIIIRGAAYALRTGASGRRELRVIETASGVSSILVPFSLGLVIGAIAAGRVPVGNAAGPLVSSWLSPVPIVIGVLAVAVSAYMAAIFLAADAARHGEPELERAMRTRGLAAGVVAGAVAVVGLIILSADAHHLYAALTTGAPLAVVVISVLAGLATLVLLLRRHYEACSLHGGAGRRRGHRGLGARTGAGDPARPDRPPGGGASGCARRRDGGRAGRSRASVSLSRPALPAVSERAAERARGRAGVLRPRRRLLRLGRG